MNAQLIKLAQLREKLMLNRKVICTGNPSDPSTLASGFIKIFSNITFIHRDAGWDLTDRSTEARTKLKELFSQHNTFINASYIAPYTQSYLLEVCNQSVKFCDVFNIGSTHEYDNLGTINYTQSKLDLRNKSLQLNTYRFRTHHVIVGRIKKAVDPKSNDDLDISTICNTIPWIMQQSFNVPLICIDQRKTPW
jgi:hypothetical protein